MATKRITRRFWISLPFIVLMVVAGLALIYLTIASVFARGDYDSGNYRSAEGAYSAHRTLTTYWPQPWKATFNEGTSQLGKDDFFAARGTLEIALEQVPDGDPVEDGPDGAIDPESAECMVRTNLSLAIEGLAVEARDARNRGEAIDFYNEALDVIGPCTSDGESESDEEDESEDEQDGGEGDEQDQDSGGDDGDDQDQDSGDDGDDQDQDSGDEGDDQDQGQDQDQQDQDQSTQDRIEQRQREQRDDTREEQQGGQGGGGSGDGDDDDGDSGGGGGGSGQDDDDQDDQGGGGGQQQDPRLDELEERNRDAAEQGGGGSGGGFGGGQNW